MFNVGGGEMLAVLLLALLVLGPERLPKAVGEVGKWVGQLRRMSSGFQDELRKAMDAANLTPDDGDTPFAPGEEAHRALPPGIEEEVRVVHGTGGDEVASAGPPDPEPGEAADDPPAPAADDDASVTPLHPRRDDETRATG